MSNKSTVLYTHVFEYLKTKMNLYPSKIMCDYEMSMRKAAKEVWTNVQVKGCWFHYIQAIRRKIISLRHLSRFIKINQFAYSTMQMFLHLPLLPIEKIENGFNAIVEFQLFHDLSQHFDEFNKYFANTWKNKFSFSSLCISNEIHKTNNYIESYNAKIKRIIQRNPSMYNFLSKYLNISYQRFV